MKNIAPFLARSLNSKRFYLVLLCGVVLAFLFILFSNLTNLFTGFIPILAIPGSFFFFILFIIPGFLAARQLIIRDIIDKKHLLLLSIVFSSLTAYVVFWIYFFSHFAGRTVSVVIIVASVVMLIAHFKKFKDELLDEDFVTPLTLMFFAGSMYLGILFLYDFYDLSYFSTVANHRFLPSLPIDNVIPFYFMEGIFYGESLDGFMGDWLSSDRPPLFSAMLLLVRQLAEFMDRTMFYQFVGTFIQCIWIPAFYSLCKFFSFEKKIRSFIVGSAVFSGVFVINSTFLWPKFSAAMFFSLLFLMVFELSKQDRLTKKSAQISIIIGICAALGFLSHGGIAFSFLALVLAVIVTEKRVVFFKHAAFAIVPFVFTYLPWILYQRLVDPPGNRLNKEHLAGVIGVNDYTFTEALYIGFSERTIGMLISKTIANFNMMFASFPGDFSSVEALRNISFTRLFGTALVLNIFLIILAFYFIRTYCLEKQQLSYRNKVMFFFTFFSLTLWPMMMMAYNQTIIHQGSYVNLFIVFILIAFGAKHSNKILINIAYVSNIILFALLWIVNTNLNIFEAPFSMSLRMFAVTLVSAILFLVYLHRKPYIEEAESNV